MKIAFDGLNIRKGGGQTVMLRLARAFAKAGHDVVILSGTPEVEERAGDLGERIEIQRIPAAQSAFGALRFRHQQWDSRCAKYKCDAVLGFNYWIPTRLPQATFHINVIPFLPFRQRRAAVGLSRAMIQARYAKRALERSTLNIFESKHVLNLARSANSGQVRNPNIRYIGVELPQDVTTPDVPEPVLAAVTSPAFHKHNEYLFDLHRVLNQRESGTEIGLKLIGITPEALDANELVAARRDYALSQPSIEFIGYVDRVRLFNELANSLALVSFSELESFFMVALEAMAVGCPAIACDVSSIRESVGDAGMLVPPGNVRAAATHIEALLDPQSHREWRAKGLAWVQQFEADRCADAIVELCGGLPQMST